MNTLEILDGEWLPPDKGGVPPLVKEKKPRRVALGTARGIRRELACLYTDLMQGRIDTDAARTGGFLLRCTLESLRMDEIETRLAALEGQE